MKILITGGSKGLGLEIAKRVSLNLNYRVLITYNKTYPAQLEKIKNIQLIKIDFKSGKLPSFLTDIDCLINNYHSGYSFKNVTKHTSKYVAESFLTNISPLIDLNNHFISKMKNKRSGTLISIISSTIKPPFKLGMGIYTAEKTYLKVLTEFWRLELDRYGINVVNIYPRMLNTSFNSSIDKRMLEIIKKRGGFSEIDHVVTLIIKALNSPREYSKKENFI